MPTSTIWLRRVPCRCGRRTFPTFCEWAVEQGDHWARFIEDTAAASACPVDYVAAPLLAAASAAIGHARWARAGEMWVEPPHIWCGSVGDSGDGKSPGADVIHRHVIRAIERKMTIDFPDQLREAQAAIEIAKAKHENWKAEVKEAIKEHKTPPLPRRLMPSAVSRRS